MSRDYDAYKNSYGNAHRSYAGQQTRHILGNDLLSHYGASTSRYADAQRSTEGINYRMGGVATNGRDTRIDNAVISTVFAGQRGGGYDAYALANNCSHSISYQRQADALGQRFDTAKAMYQQTGEHKYFMMCRDFRAVADNNLQVDLRQWRMPGKK